MPKLICVISLFRPIPYISFSIPLPHPCIFFFCLLFQQSTDPDYVINPCYPKGFSTNMTASSVYDTECTEKPGNYDPKQNYFMVGSGNSDKCESLVKSLFDFKNCTSPQCSFNGVEQPPVTGNFLVKERLVKRKCVYFGRVEYENLFFFFFLSGIRWVLFHRSCLTLQRHIRHRRFQQVCCGILPDTLERGEFL